MKTAAVYIRVSTDKQLDNSPESQLQAIKRYAEINDYVILEEHIYAEQEGQSGRQADKRPEFQRMITTAKTKPKPFDAILVWKFSRFARNREDSIVYKRLLRDKCGIDVISVGENLGASDNMLNDLVEAIIESMDEYFSRNLAEEVKRGMTNKVRNGEPVANAPYGYDLINKQLVINEEQAQIVKMIFEEYASGTALRPLVLKLNSLGIKTKRGYDFQVSSLIYILTNPVYIGEIRWSAEGRINISRFRNPRYENENFLYAKGKHQPILERELFDAVQKKMAEISMKYPRKAKQAGAVNMLLKGLARCSSCGSTLVSTHGHIEYQCSGYGRGICKNSHNIKANKLENMVICELEKIFFGADLSRFTAQLEPVYEDKSYSLLDVQVKKQRAKIERIKTGYEAGLYSLDDARERLTVETAALDNLLALQDGGAVETELKAKAIEIKGGFADILRNPDVPLAAKNDFLRSFIDKIIFSRDKDTKICAIEIYFK